MLKILGWAVAIVFIIGLLVVFGVVDLIAAPRDNAKPIAMHAEQQRASLGWAQPVRATHLIGAAGDRPQGGTIGYVTDLAVDLTHALVRTRDGGTRPAPLEVREPAIELTGTIIERGLVSTSDGARQTAKLRTPDGRIVSLDFGPPGGEASIAEGEAVVLAAHPGVLRGRPVFVVDVVIERLTR